MFVFKPSAIISLTRIIFPLGEKDSMIFDCTERYDPVTKQWAAVASLNFPRCGVGVCPCHGALYALGKYSSGRSDISYRGKSLLSHFFPK